MSVLAEIVDRKRIDVAERIGAHDGNFEHVQPSDRSLAEALAAPGARYIMECKRSSPSKGDIRPDADPVQVAHAYTPVADAISVLCDGPYFGGSLADLTAVRQHTHLPVLCKDFIVDPFQVAEAREAGADAVLLMLSVLDDDTYRRCADVAAQFDLDVLTEVHDEVELHRALALGAAIIGINNRDLRTLDVDLDTTLELAAQVPVDRLVVAESGIATRADVARLALSADAFLVGSSLMAQDDIADAARALVFGRVKVCGLTTGEGATAAERAGARWGGVVFAESPRQVDLKMAEQLAQSTRLPLVGVFVDAEPDLMAKTAVKVPLAAVQLHGSESAETVSYLRQLLPDVEIWKAVHDVSDLHTLPEIDRWIIDAAPTGGLRGGTGQTWDWSTLTDADRVIVAGGLTPENAYEASQLGAFGLDVSSGVETIPAIKDPAKIDAFFAALRGPSRGDV